jgi:hypothetical protein
VVAVNLADRVVTVAQVTTAYDITDMAATVRDRERQWFAPLRR